MPLKVGDQAPNFELLDTDLKKVNLYDVLGRGQYVVLLFFLALSLACARRSCARSGTACSSWRRPRLM